MPLSRSIGKWDLVLMMVNSIIGAGIFGLPSKIYALTRFYSIAAFLTCAIIVFVFVLIFSEVSSRYDKTGGPYIYTRDAFGRFPGFMMACLSEISRAIIFAALINLLVSYVSFLIPLFNFPVTRIIAICAVISFLAAINILGIKLSTRINNILTVSKLIPLTGFILIGLFHLQPELLQVKSDFQSANFSSSVLLLIFAFGGFDGVIVNSGEMKNPRINIPFALIVSIMFVTVYYCLIQIVCVGTLPTLSTSEKPLADAATRFLGTPGGKIISTGAIVSILASLNLNMIVGSRLPYSMAAEKQLPKIFAFIHRRFQTPVWSIVFYSILVLSLSLPTNFLRAVSVSAITRVIIYLIVSASLIRLRKNGPAARNYFKLKAGGLFACMGISIAVWLLLHSKADEFVYVLVLLGISSVVYFLFNKPLFEKEDHYTP